MHVYSVSANDHWVKGSTGDEITGNVCIYANRVRKPICFAELNPFRMVVGIRLTIKIKRDIDASAVFVVHYLDRLTVISIESKRSASNWLEAPGDLLILFGCDDYLWRKDKAIV